MARWIPRDTKIDFIGKRFIAFAVSTILIIGSLIALATEGLNYGIDFTGGTLIEIRVDRPDAEVNISGLRDNLNTLGVGAISIQEFGAPNDLLIRIPEQPGDEEAQQAAIETVRVALDTRYDAGGVDYRRVEYVGPQVGEELKRKGIYAVLFSILGMLIYIWIRFEWQFSVAAIGALLHDSILTIGLFAITGMEFNLSTVAAILMIAGYSVNDTVVVFDRIRENLRKFKKMGLNELLNVSVNDTLSRTIVTSLTTLIALTALWAFGGEVIRGFVDALIFGIVVGTYSSIFVAAPLLTIVKPRKREDEMKKEPEPA